METLYVRNFGPIKSDNIQLADFTIFSGVNASGKGILLQLLKLIIDKQSIPEILKINNYDWRKNKNKFLELYFGEAMGFIWNKKTEIKFNDENFNITSVINETPASGKRSTKEHLFYIPAQRVVTMAQVWPRAFGTFDIGDPFVLKQFSETVRTLMEKRNFKDIRFRWAGFPEARENKRAFA